MSAYRFASDANSSHFLDAMDTIGAKYAPWTPLARPTSNPPLKRAPETTRQELHDRRRGTDA